MLEIILHAKELFVLFLFPALGYYFDLKLSKNKRTYIFILGFLILIPIILGYDYIFGYLINTISYLIILASFYSLFSGEIETKKRKIMTSYTLCFLLFFGMGFFLFLNMFSGYQKTESTWKIEKYKIDYIRDQGFAGGPLMKYQLKKYTFIPILSKTIETSTKQDSLNKCIVYFDKSQLIFDKCKAKLKEKTMR